jgi:hypothetical protein
MTRGFGRFLRQNVIALLALFLALGGTSFAAASLINGSKIKPHTIAKNRLTNKAIKQLKGNRGAQGLRGPTGAQGVQGVQGPPGPFPATLPAGKTIVGTYDMEGTAAAANGLVTSEISYLYSAPSQTAVFVPNGGSNPNCPGNSTTPTANPGFTCVYEFLSLNAGSHGINFNRASGPGLYIFSAAAGQFDSAGTWAATAPASSAPARPVNQTPATIR